MKEKTCRLEIIKKINFILNSSLEKNSSEMKFYCFLLFLVLIVVSASADEGFPQIHRNGYFRFFKIIVVNF